MFNLSPIPPTTSSERLAAPATKPGDWCGTPLPGTPTVPDQTSVIAPWHAASQRADAAQGKLAEAVSVLTQRAPMHATIGIPEQNGPDSPDNPWYIGARPYQRAAQLATEAIADIRTARSMPGLSSDVHAAFDRAAQQALAGVRELTVQTMRPIDIVRVAEQLRSSSLQLGLAKDLIALEHDNTTVPPLTRPRNPEPNWRVLPAR